MSTPSETDILQAIREELDAIKVPGALEAEASQTWQDLDVDSLDLETDRPTPYGITSRQ